MEQNLRLPDVWVYFLLSQLVVVNVAVPAHSQCRILHFHDDCRLYPATDGGYLDEPLTKKQHDGRRIQYRKRIVHAGNQVNGKRVFGKPTNPFLVQKENVERLD